jgi:hypothetical protein
MLKLSLLLLSKKNKTFSQFTHVQFMYEQQQRQKNKYTGITNHLFPQFVHFEIGHFFVISAVNDKK